MIFFSSAAFVLMLIMLTAIGVVFNYVFVACICFYLLFLFICMFVELMADMADFDMFLESLEFENVKILF